MPTEFQFWLEVAKLAIQLTTPVVVVFIGIYIHRVAKRFEHMQWRNQKLIEQRIFAYNEIAPKLNDVLCYFTYVGNWKKFNPQQIVDMKREIDKSIYLSSTFFSGSFFKSCMEFQDLCFDTYNGWPADARLRTKWGRRRDAAGSAWNTAWETCFSPDVSDAKCIQNAYNMIMRAFASEIGVYEADRVPEQAYVPQNIH